MPVSQRVQGLRWSRALDADELGISMLVQTVGRLDETTGSL
jgi:hypothetical protein